MYMCVLLMMWVGGVIIGEPSNQFHVHLLICVVLSELMQEEHGETALFLVCGQGR